MQTQNNPNKLTVKTIISKKVSLLSRENETGSISHPSHAANGKLSTNPETSIASPGDIEWFQICIKVGGAQLPLISWKNICSMVLGTKISGEKNSAPFLRGNRF